MRTQWELEDHDTIPGVADVKVFRVKTDEKTGFTFREEQL